MTEGFYTNPKWPSVLSTKQKMGPIAVVVTAHVPDGQIKAYGKWNENKLSTIKRTLASHNHFNPGIGYNLYLIDNGSKDDEGKKWLASKGALTRKNEGYSFGGWKSAWESLKDQYDFFLFTEDDIAPSHDGWLEEIMDKFQSAKDIGAVGSFVEGRSLRETMSREMWRMLDHGDRDMMYNFDGSFTFTSADILRQVDEHGGLTVFPTPPNSPTVNEIAFVSRILELGYKIASFDDGKHTLIHGSEVFTGDLMCRYDRLCPLININARRVVPQVAEAFSWYA